MLKKILLWTLALILTAYIVAAVTIARQWAATDVCRGVTVTVTDSATAGFVTVRELVADLDSFPVKAPGMRLRDINTHAIVDRLMQIDQIETASAIVYTDGTIDITAVPLKPVARIFDDNTHRSYYINRQGKRMWATARYHTDVPVVSGRFDSVFPARSVLPLINYLEQHPRWDSLVTHIHVDSPSDIMLVPIVHGHVINIGTADDLADKFERLDLAYRYVMPVKGWNFYDTVSVKWDGQIVATRRYRPLPPPPDPADLEADIEDPDEGTMSTEISTP